jgi:cyclase
MVHGSQQDFSCPPINGGRVPTGISTLAWAREAVDRGAGEILLTSMDHDGVKNGFALEITRAVSTAVSAPVIASGGAGNMAHFTEVFTQGAADAALAAGIFHFGEISLPDLKNYLLTQNICVRT